MKDVRLYRAAGCHHWCLPASVHGPPSFKIFADLVCFRNHCFLFFRSNQRIPAFAAGAALLDQHEHSGKAAEIYLHILLLKASQIFSFDFCLEGRLKHNNNLVFTRHVDTLVSLALDLCHLSTRFLKCSRRQTSACGCSRSSSSSSVSAHPPEGLKEDKLSLQGPGTKGGRTAGL